MNEKQTSDDPSFAFVLGLFIGAAIIGMISIFIVVGMSDRLNAEIYALKCEKLNGKIISDYKICIKNNEQLVIK